MIRITNNIDNNDSDDDNNLNYDNDLSGQRKEKDRGKI